MTWDKNFKDRYILIEPTDICNLDCIMCTRALVGVEDPHNVPKGFMDFELFKKIIDDIEIGEEPMAIKLFWLGESLIHKDFKKMLIHMHEKIKHTKAYIDLHTNAELLSLDLMDTMIKIGEKIPRITLSIDATTPEIYKKIRRGGNFNKVIENIKLFYQMREKNHSVYPSFIFQFIIMEENQEQAKAFVEFWESFINTTAKKDLYGEWEELSDERKIELLKEYGILEKFLALK